MANLYALSAYTRTSIGNGFDNISSGDSFTLAGAPDNDLIVSDLDASTPFSSRFDAYLNGTLRSLRFRDTFTLTDGGGATYTLYEFRLGSTRYYIFEGDAPAPGTTLTVSNQPNPGSITYADLDSDDEFVDTTTGATSGADTIALEDGNDTALAGAGNDSIDGGAGDDSILGEGGSDTIAAGAGADTVDGGTGADSIEGGGGADSLLGGTGADTIRGEGGNDFIDGGADADQLYGGDGFDTFVADGTADTIFDFNTASGQVLDDDDATNNDFIDLTGFYTNLKDLRDDQDDDGILQDAGGLVLSGVSGSQLFTDNTGVVCFTRGTRIVTVRGCVRVEALKRGDLVVTADRGPQPIRWTARRTLRLDELMAKPHLAPIHIAANAIAPGRPACDMRVSPQHRMMVPTTAQRAAFTISEVLVPAIRLVNGDTIRQVFDAPSVTYVHFLCDRHEIVMSDGTWSESFHPGPQGIASLGDPVRAELFDLFPALAYPFQAEPHLAREEANGPESRLLALSGRYSGPDGD